MVLQPGPLVRLRFKQPCPAVCKAKAKKDHPLKTRQIGSRKAAVAEGLVPKARRPFALYVKEKSQLCKGASKQDYQEEMKTLGRAWRSEAAEVREAYGRKCHQEFLEQRDSMRVQGLPLRKQVLKSIEAVRPVVDKKALGEKMADYIQVGRFEILTDREPLGEGTYGCVLPAWGPSGRLCAVKVYKCKKGSQMHDFKQEVMVFQQIEKIPLPERMLFPFFIEADASGKPFPFVALEFGGPSLFQVLQDKGAMDQQSVLCVSSQLKAALAALHSLKLLHLDVKPANILWVPQTLQLKLTDFGMSEMVGIEPRQLRFNEYVTVQYRPPELWSVSQVEMCRNLTASVDIWSYGCVLFDCLTGKNLMRPCESARTCYAMVQAWCSAWKLLRSKTKKSSRLGGTAERLNLRLSQAGVWGSNILSALNPEPSLRKWRKPGLSIHFVGLLHEGFLCSGVWAKRTSVADQLWPAIICCSSC